MSMSLDPTEDVREDLHDAVDAAVDAATRDKAIDDRLDSLSRRLDEIPISPGVDYDRIQEMIDAKMMVQAVPAIVEPESDSDDKESDDDDDASDDVEDAAEAAEDAIENASSLDEKIAAQANLSVQPEIPERPPIKTHPLFKRLFGGR